MSHHTPTITRPNHRPGDRQDTRPAIGHRGAGTPSQAALVAAARNGCQSAEATLYDHHRSMIAAVARRHGLDEHHCADVVQRAWMKARQGLPRLRRDDRFGPWLAAIARNESISVIRSTAREVGLPDQDMADDHLRQPDRQVVAAEEKGQLRAAMERLAPNDRELVRLLFEEDLAYQQVAAVLGKPMGSIGPTRGRVLRRLRHLIEGGEPVASLAA